jgi:hypothetical protein
MSQQKRELFVEAAGLPHLLQKDSIVNSVIAKFQERSELGMKKYGVTLDREDLSFNDWVQHMQEELMDAILYLEKLKQSKNEGSSL